MLSTWVPSTLVLLSLNPLELSLILDLSIWLLPQFCVMTRLLETTNSRNTTLFPEVLSKETKLIRDARPWPSICTSLRPKRSYPRLPPSWPMDLPSFKVSFGKITLAFSPSILPKRQLWPNCKMSSRKTSALSSNSCHSTSLKALVTIPMVSSVFPLIRTWKRRDSTTCGPWRTTVLSIELWFHSLLPVKKWVRPLMPCSVAITPLKSSTVLKDWRLSKTSRIGSEPGLLRVKECTMATSPCKSLEKTPLTLPSLILAHHSFQFPQMFLRKSDKSGLLLFPTLIALVTRLSATSRTLVRILPPKSSLLVSKWVIMFSRSTLSNICTSLPTRNATLWSINADSLVRIRTCSWSVMPS